MPTSHIPDKTHATADLLREEAFRLSKVLEGLEVENGQLASQLLAWQKWYKKGFKSQILFLEHQVNQMAISVSPSNASRSITDGGKGSSSGNPFNMSSITLAPLAERPEVSIPPLPVRGANGELVTPSFGEVVTFSDGLLQKIQERGKQTKKELAGPPGKPVASSPLKKGQLSEAAQKNWEEFMARQTTETYRLAKKESLEQQKTIADFRQQELSTNLGFKGPEGLRRILRLRFGSLVEGWRIGLSPQGKKRVSFKEFCTALNERVGFAGNLKHLWLELCPPDKCNIGLEDLDRRASADVESLRNVLIDEYGSIRAAWKRIFKPVVTRISVFQDDPGQQNTGSRGGVTEGEFTSACLKAGFPEKRAKRAFRFIMRLDTDHIHRVLIDDLDPEPNQEASPKAQPTFKPAASLNLKEHKALKAQILRRNSKLDDPSTELAYPTLETKVEPTLQNKVEPSPAEIPLEQGLAFSALQKKVIPQLEPAKEDSKPTNESPAPSPANSPVKQEEQGGSANKEPTEQTDQPTEKPPQAETSPPKTVHGPEMTLAARRKAKGMLGENSKNGMLPMYIEAVLSMREARPDVSGLNKDSKDQEAEARKKMEEDVRKKARSSFEGGANSGELQAKMAADKAKDDAARAEAKRKMVEDVKKKTRRSLEGGVKTGELTALMAEDAAKDEAKKKEAPADPAPVDPAPEGASSA